MRDRAPAWNEVVDPRAVTRVSWESAPTMRSFVTATAGCVLLFGPKAAP
jgi:hypothetical protein